MTFAQFRTPNIKSDLPAQIPLDTNLGELVGVSTQHLSVAPDIPNNELAHSYYQQPVEIGTKYVQGQSAASSATMPPTEVRSEVSATNCSSDCGEPRGLPDYGPLLPNEELDGGFSDPGTVSGGGGGSTYSGSTPSGGSSSGESVSEIQSARMDYDNSVSELSRANSELSSANSDYSSAQSSYNSAASDLRSAINSLQSMQSSYDSAVSQRNAAERDRNSAVTEHNMAQTALHHAQIEAQRLNDQIKANQAEQKSLEKREAELKQNIENGVKQQAETNQKVADQVASSKANREMMRAYETAKISEHNEVATSLNVSTRLQEGVESIEDFLAASNQAVPTTEGDVRVGDLAMSESDVGYTTPVPGREGGLPSGFSAEGVDQPALWCGSIIQVDSLTLGEMIPLTGTDLKLYYFSDRVPGRRGDYQVRVDLQGDASVTKNILTLKVAGRESTRELEGSRKSYDFAWNGLDAQGLPSPSKVPIKITLTRQTGAGSQTNSWRTFVGNYRAEFQGLGGWSVSQVHFYGVNEKRIYFGDGRTRESSVDVGPTGQYRIPSGSGDEVYIFNSRGVHLETRHGLTGALLYSFGYDSRGRLTEVADAFENTTKFQRAGDSPNVTVTTPYGQRSVLSLSGEGWLESMSDPLGGTYRMSYLAGGLLASFTKPEGQTNTFKYDELGYLEKDMGAAGDSLLFTGNIRGSGKSAMDLLMTTAERRESTYSLQRFVDSGYRREQRDADGNFSIFESKAKNFDRVTTPDVRIETRYQPDARFGSMVEVAANTRVIYAGLESQPSVVTQTQAIVEPQEGNPFGFKTLTTAVTANGLRTETVYAPQTRGFVSTTPMGRKVTVQLDPWGRPRSEQVFGRVPTVYAYDERGRPQTISTGERKTTFGYNENGLLAHIVDPLGLKRAFEYDVAGRLVKQTSPDGREIKFDYNRNGQLISLTPPKRPAYRFVYELWERAARFVTPGSQTSYEYNRDKQLASITQPGGDVIRMVYGADTGRLDQMTIRRGVYQYGYSDHGRMTSLNSPDGVTLSFERFGTLPRKVSTSWMGVATAVVQNYDANFRVASIDIESPNETSSIVFGYDGDNLLLKAGEQSIERDAVTGTMSNVRLGETEDRYRYSQTHGELSSYKSRFGKRTVFHETFGRDDIGRIQSRREKTPGERVLRYAYEYDKAGRLARVTESGNEIAKYTYDDNGNRIQTQYAGEVTTAEYDEEDRVRRYGNISFGYGDNGRLATRTNATTGEQVSYDYDEFGNLLRAVRPAEADIPAFEISYAIDGLNRRVAKKVSGQVLERYVYHSPLQIAAVLDAQGAIRSRFVYGTRVNVPDYMVRDGVTYKIVSDYHGSPRFIIDVRTGEIAQELRYDEFGRVLSDSRPGFQPFGFAGGLYDTDTGLVRFGARDYDASTGRWTAQEPLLFGGGDTNLYGYTFNDPINFIDPAGTAAWLVSRTDDILGLGVIGNHNFIVVEDDQSGQTLVISFANSKGYDPRGLLVRDVGGETNRSDRAVLAPGSGVVGQYIDAPDSTVLEVARGIMPTGYGYLGPNSNTAAQFIADVSQGSRVPTPSAFGTLLGVVGAGERNTGKLGGACWIR
jgi:RHS repeat-associated protein